MKKLVVSILTVLILASCKSPTDNNKTIIRDTVVLEDLAVGEKYELTAYLIPRSSDEIYIDADSKEVKVTKEFKARKSKMEKEVKLVFNNLNAREKKLKLNYELKRIERLIGLDFRFSLYFSC